MLKNDSHLLPLWLSLKDDLTDGKPIMLLFSYNSPQSAAERGEKWQKSNELTYKNIPELFYVSTVKPVLIIMMLDVFFLHPLFVLHVIAVLL